MAYNVKFLKGTQAGYEGLTSKEATSFYLTDAGNLYIGETKLSNGSDLEAAKTTLQQNIQANADDITVIEGEIGNATLTTTAQTLTEAINELKNAISASGEAGIVELVKSQDGLTYTLNQGGVKVGEINIPKDMVVQSGEVVVNPEGQPTGTYIKLVLANSEDILYINVASLIDIYTGKAAAAQIQVTVNGYEISAEIVDGSVDSAALGANAVITAKIADKNVTKAKLANDVQASLGKADSAVQAVVTGTGNGTITVDGTDVPVKGLGSAAYVNTSAFDAAGSATAAETNAKAYTDTAKTTLQGSIDTVAGELATEVEARETLESKVDTALGDGGSVATQITDAINKLDVTDTAESGQYVSAVNQTDGKITVTRAAIKTWETEISTAKSEAINAAATDATSKADAAETAAKAHAETKAADAETNAKTYTDTALTWGTF